MIQKFLALTVVFLLAVLPACRPESGQAPTATPPYPTPYDHPLDPTRSPTATPAKAGAQDPAGSPTPPHPHPSPTPTEHSGTIITTSDDSLTLTHPEYLSRLALPADRLVSYDTCHELHAHDPDQTIFLRLQAQRWPADAPRPSDAAAYVAHWRSTDYGDIFPLFADGDLVEEQETGPEKFGGPYLIYEFVYTTQGRHHLQVYASAGRPTAGMVTAWDAEADSAAAAAAD